MSNTDFSSAMTWIITLRTLCFVDLASLYRRVDRPTYSLSWHIYVFSVRVTCDCVPIVGRNSCVCVTFGTCHSVWMTVWCAPCVLDRLRAHSHPKRTEKTNRHTNKNCAPIRPYPQDHTFRTVLHLFPAETSNLKIL